MPVWRPPLLALLPAAVLAAPPLAPTKPAAPPVELAAPAGGPTLKGMACAGRSDCRIVHLHPAGTAADGTVLTVGEIRLGPAERPTAATNCEVAAGADGSVEWWLLENGRPQRRLLGPCPTATVTVAPDELVRVQGGNTRRLGLHPPRLLAEERCEAGPGTVVTRAADAPAQALARRWIAGAPGGAPAAACPPVRSDWNPAPAAAVLAALALPVVEGTAPDGDTLGDCALALGGEAAPGFGAPASAAGAPLRAVLADRATLLLELPVEPASARVEVWLSPAGMALRPAAGALSGYAVGVDGRLSVLAGRGPRPRLTRHTATTAADTPVVVLRLVWDTLDLGRAGVTLAYIRPGPEGAPLRLATSGFARGLPLVLPLPARLPVHCEAVEGHLRLRPDDPFAAPP